MSPHAAMLVESVAKQTREVKQTRMREKDTSVGEEEDTGRKKERMKDEVDFLLNKSASPSTSVALLQQIRNLFSD